MVQPHLSRNALPRRGHLSILTGAGATFTDSNGREYIDLSSQTVNLLQGQAHPAINDAVLQQMAVLTFADQDFHLRLNDEAINALYNLMPPHLTAFNIKMCNGTDAVESAVKQARRATGKAVVLTVEGIYLGQSTQTIHLRGLGIRPDDILRGSSESVIFGPGPYCADQRHEAPLCPIENGSAFSDLIAEHRDDLCSVLVDPIMVSAGYFGGRCQELWLRTIADTCHRLSVPLILDESQTFGWVPDVLLSRHWDLKPDLVVLAKGVAGGFPQSVCISTEEFDNLEWGDADYTNGGHPSSVAALLANCKLLADNSEQLRFADLVRELDCIASLSSSGRWRMRGVGLIRGLEVLDNGHPADPTMVSTISSACLNQGVYVRAYRSCLGIKPPRVISASVLKRSVLKITELVEEMAEQ